MEIFESNKMFKSFYIDSFSQNKRKDGSSDMLKKTIKLMLCFGLILTISGCSAIQDAVSDAVADAVSQALTGIQGTATMANQSTHSGIAVSVYQQGIDINNVETLSLITHSSPSVITSTSTSGNYAITNVGVTTSALNTNTTSFELPMGSYTLVFSKDGYQSATVNNIPVQIGSGYYDVDAVELSELPTINLIEHVQTNFYGDSLMALYYRATSNMTTITVAELAHPYVSVDGINYTEITSGFTDEFFVSGDAQIFSAYSFESITYDATVETYYLRLDVDGNGSVVTQYSN